MKCMNKGFVGLFVMGKVCGYCVVLYGCDCC